MNLRSDGCEILYKYKADCEFLVKHSSCEISGSHKGKVVDCELLGFVAKLS